MSISRAPQGWNDDLFEPTLELPKRIPEQPTTANPLEITESLPLTTNERDRAPSNAVGAPRRTVR